MAEDHSQHENYLENQLTLLVASYDESLAAPNKRAKGCSDRFLLFTIGDAVFGIPIGDLLQIIPAADLVQIPLAPATMLGAVAFRQEIVSVLNLRTILELKSDGGRRKGPKHDWILILRPLSQRAAVAVDGLTALHSTDSSAFQDDPYQSLPIAGKFRLGNVPVSILNIKRIISSNLLSSAGAQPST